MCRPDDSSLPTPKIVMTFHASTFIVEHLGMCFIHEFNMLSMSAKQLNETPFVAICDLSTEPVDGGEFADLLVALADKDSDAALPPALTSIRAAPLVGAFSTVWGIIESWRNAREECLPLTRRDLPIGIIMFAKAHTPLNFGLMPLPIMPPTLELLRFNMENPTPQVPLDLSDAIGLINEHIKADKGNNLGLRCRMSILDVQVLRDYAQKNDITAKGDKLCVAREGDMFCAVAHEISIRKCGRACGETEKRGPEGVDHANRITSTCTVPRIFAWNTCRAVAHATTSRSPTQPPSCAPPYGNIRQRLFSDECDGMKASFSDPATGTNGDAVVEN
ncbi:hypothetical protein HMN09_01331200 [Mycena chlorophos]|uniref:Uncharacterized protein n=1 Tax=Mycena chlorophos TaxID=658473 RepID=A0A8H6VTN4_MYCCL|nr:hypothetical protein HMN09_01331200 [Mycena chlorophos]